MSKKARMYKLLNKLIYNYIGAQCDLIEYRDKIYPPGTLVRFRYGLKGIYTVATGSLYADQVMLDNSFHASITSIEKIEDRQSIHVNDLSDDEFQKILEAEIVAKNNT